MKKGVANSEIAWSI